MKRKSRWMQNGLTVFSLLLALGVAASWVGSYWRSDLILYSSGDGLTIRWVNVSPAFVTFGVDRANFPQEKWKIPRGFIYCRGQTYVYSWQVHPSWGIGWGRNVSRPTGIVTNRGIVIHHAWLLALFTALPTFRANRWLGRRPALEPGHCIQCGYDLRATPDCCPECGTVVEEGKART